MQWKLNSKQGRIVFGNKTPGQALNQLNSPNDVVFDKKTNSLIIADQGNRRILRWSLNENTQIGEVLIPNISCSNLAIDQEGSIYVSDNVKHEVRRWKKGEKEGTIVAGGNGQGRQLNQLNNPTYLFIDQEYSLYVTDQNNYRIMKWAKDAKTGLQVLSCTGSMNRQATKWSEIAGVFVNSFEQVFAADSDLNRVARWHRDQESSNIILPQNPTAKTETGSNGFTSLTFDNAANLYVTDTFNNRVLKFEIDFD